ncbi:MAG TPA: hypothetical protein VIN10_07275 [Bacteroidales bacterium]
MSLSKNKKHILIEKLIFKNGINHLNGTSCRHQIQDGTERQALHPVEVLFDALVG